MVHSVLAAEEVEAAAEGPAITGVQTPDTEGMPGRILVQITAAQFAAIHSNNNVILAIELPDITALITTITTADIISVVIISSPPSDSGSHAPHRNTEQLSAQQQQRVKNLLPQPQLWFFLGKHQQNGSHRFNKVPISELKLRCA